MLRGYTVKIYPNKAQQVLLGKYLGCCRWVYNQMIEINQKRYHRTGKGMSGYDMQNYLPKIKKQYPWLAEVGSQALQITCHNLAQAYNGFFKGKARYPRFKKRGQKETFTCINNSWIDETHVRLPKLGEIRYRGGEMPIGNPKRFTVRERAGKYYCSILFEIPAQEPEPRAADNILGVDLGISDMVVTSAGQIIKALHPMRTSKAKLRTASKVYSRTQFKSNHRVKARHNLVLLHEKVANQRKDFNHKLSRMLVDKDENQAFAIENLNVKGMLSNHRLAFHIADMGWSQFLMFLKYKAAAVGKQILEVGRFFPSSKTCSACGIVRESLPLDVRRWTCSCGAEHHRDINAAINIAYEAARNSVSKRGGDVSPKVIRPEANPCET